MASKHVQNRWVGCYDLGVCVKRKKSGSHEWDFKNFMNRICIEKCNYNELLLFALQNWSKFFRTQNFRKKNFKINGKLYQK